MAVTVYKTGGDKAPLCIDDFFRIPSFQSPYFYDLVIDNRYISINQGFPVPLMILPWTITRSYISVSSLYASFVVSF